MAPRFRSPWSAPSQDRLLVRVDKVAVVRRPLRGMVLQRASSWWTRYPRESKPGQGLGIRIIGGLE